LMKLDTRRLAVTARALEGHLSRQDMLLAGGFSAADCMMGFNIEAVFRFLPKAEFPALAAYRDRMTARPAYRRALDRAGGDSIYQREFYELPDA
ncbi:MAG TPA: glutathione S-transferase, partial [Paracoccus sp.]|nr:glutathione S-transferase [Paracoccus sp. (in: a-proteobacteria)]